MASIGRLSFLHSAGTGLFCGAVDKDKNRKGLNCLVAEIGRRKSSIPGYGMGYRVFWCPL